MKKITANTIKSKPLLRDDIYDRSLRFVLVVRADRAVRRCAAINQSHTQHNTTKHETRQIKKRDEGDSKNALLEVRSGSGGDEAAAFAKELFDMYRRFAELKGWKFEGLTCSSIDAGNLRRRRKSKDLEENNNEKKRSACGGGVDWERVGGEGRGA